MKRLVIVLAVVAAVLASAPSAAAQNPPSPSDSLRILTLRPGDVAKISVWGHEDLSGEFPVDENFDLYYPIVGAINVRDMPVPQLRQRLTHELEQLFQRPFLVLTPLFRIAVLGEVMRPSLYSVDPTMTIFDIIAEAGGPTRDANQRRIQLVRSGEMIPLALNATALGRATLRDLGVRSGDHIVMVRKRITMQEFQVGLQIATLALQIYLIVR
jgi:polysaccharide export outer membrane protein